MLAETCQVVVHLLLIVMECHRVHAPVMLLVVPFWPLVVSLAQAPSSLHLMMLVVVILTGKFPAIASLKIAGQNREVGAYVLCVTLQWLLLLPILPWNRVAMKHRRIHGPVELLVVPAAQVYQVKSGVKEQLSLSIYIYL